MRLSKIIHIVIFRKTVFRLPEEKKQTQKKSRFAAGFIF